MFWQNSNTQQKVVENAWLIKDVMWNSIDDILSSLVARLPYLLAGFLVFFLFWFISKIIKSFFLKASTRTHLDNQLRLLISRLIGISLFILGLFTALTIVIPTFRFSDLITGLGFTTFIIGFATKDILNNLFSGVLILWQRPFKIGDYLFIGNNQGKVEYIGMRATKLRKDDGEQILIPNGDMYSSAITIRGAGAERRMILKISVGYDADISKTKEIITDILAFSEGVVNQPKPNVVVTDLAGDGVNLSIYFWINTDKNSPLQVFDKVATEIKQRLNDSGIELFPPSSVIVQGNGKDNKETEKPKEEKKKKDIL